jgi:hypothetical protein
MTIWHAPCFNVIQRQIGSKTVWQSIKDAENSAEQLFEIKDGKDVK